MRQLGRVKHSLPLDTLKTKQQMEQVPTGLYSTSSTERQYLTDILSQACNRNFDYMKLYLVPIETHR